MPNRLQIKLINDAQDNEHMLSEWESAFINNIAEYDNDRDLTEKQNSILNRISNKINRGEDRQ